MLFVFKKMSTSIVQHIHRNIHTKFLRSAKTLLSEARGYLLKIRAETFSRPDVRVRQFFFFFLGKRKIPSNKVSIAMLWTYLIFVGIPAKTIKNNPYFEKIILDPLQISLLRLWSLFIKTDRVCRVWCHF